MLRSLVTAATAAAVTGSVLMRSWDRSAGRRVAELTRARASDAWKTEERIAELETDIDESRELRAKLDAKLRAKRVELAALRGEHAELLRRYATAETERAGVLEDRRQLALEAASPVKALPPAGTTPTPATYLRANKALDELSRNAAAQEAKRTVEEARARDLAERSREADEPQGKHAAVAGEDQHTRPTSAVPARRPVPAAAAIVPYGPQPRPKRPESGFDFFGTAEGAGAQKAIEAVQHEDLADVVGEEALAEQQSTDSRAVGKVIDLTAHDETEQFDVGELRNAVS
ncbi:hypothetical protein FBY35_3178 [Streptomyces sp. SLBN-118]|nr:hypothetical protein FBY35_3178 [Streptomyces sp. SLBN-118]